MEITSYDKNLGYNVRNWHLHDSGKEQIHISSQKGRCQSGKDPQTLRLPSLGTRNTLDLFRDNFTLAIPFYRERNQRWNVDAASPSSCFGSGTVVDIDTMEDCRTPYPVYPESVKIQQDLQAVTDSYPEQLKAIATPASGPASGVSSSYHSGISTLTAAAHRAVADLFPELAAYDWEASKAGHSTKPISPPYCYDLDKMSIELDCSICSVDDLFIKSQPQPEFSDRTELSILKDMEVTICIKREVSSDCTTTLVVHTQPPKVEIEQPPHLSSNLVSLGLENLDPNPIDTSGVGSCPTVAISPRYLYKYHSTPMSPEHVTFWAGQGDYEGSMYDLPEEIPMKGTIITEERMGETVKEELDIPGGLSSDIEFDSCGVGSSPPSSATQSPTTPIEPFFAKPLALKYPPSGSDLSNSIMLPKGPTTTRSFFSRQEPHDLLRLKPKSDEVSRNRTAKKTPKELMKEQNILLLRWRSEGISYKAIKERLGIAEAESTLRGRLRALTKPKSERLRRPRWIEEDIVLLLKIVDPDLMNVKWKQVSETIVNLGGSYKFGPSTCKKQYMKLVASGRARPLTENALAKSRPGTKVDIQVGN